MQLAMRLCPIAALLMPPLHPLPRTAAPLNPRRQPQRSARVVNRGRARDAAAASAVTGGAAAVQAG